MTEEQAKKLREAFPASAVGKLPRVTCKACSDNKQQKHCDKHQRAECKVCGNYITTAHMHLDYIGHAATTDRLLQVDHEWTWEPCAVGPNGEPLIVNGGLWIKLTIAGVTRYGFGDGASIKEMIGDAIRNAAMRFGVALDLWAKEDLRADDSPKTAPAAAQQGGGGTKPAGSAAQTPPQSGPKEAELRALMNDWLELKPEFDRDAAVATIDKHRGEHPLPRHIEWLDRQIATFSKNIEAKRAESPFKAPAPKKAAA